MIQAIVRRGKVIGEEVPGPLVSKGGILIRVVNSAISSGTELSAIRGSGRSLYRRALDQPHHVKRILDMVRSEGIAAAYERVKGKLEAGSPTGYSISGVVLAVGDGVTGFKPGDAVAAAGAGLANHAEFVDVPENLVVKMPAGLGFPAASTVALGGIAMQGVRRADLRMGEMAVVIGTGILGLLAIQMLRASGIRVAAVDLDEKRLAIAQALGAEVVFNSCFADPVQGVQVWSGGHGADAVVFTAATASSAPLSQSFQMCKRRGRVVLVGVAGMEIEREDMYSKELDFLIATSYGPGRYDKAYEEKGLDYPYAYVRWTENRNMAEYLRLLSEGTVALDQMLDAVFPVERLGEAFESLSDSENKPLLAVLDYGLPPVHPDDEKPIQRQVFIPGTGSPRQGVIRVAVVGAGGFALETHLPNIQKLGSKFALHCVVDNAGSKAKDVAARYGAKYASTDVEAALADPEVDLVMIATRHDSHAPLALKALQQGKHVFVEKPLATTRQELAGILDFYQGGLDRKPVLMTGFNRRFSRYAATLKQVADARQNPLLMSYRMNAGFIPLDHWVHEHGGRMVGEACHIIDLMTFFTGSRLKSIGVESLTPANAAYSSSDNKAIILSYEDGSIGTIHYFAVGSKTLPKEWLELHFDGKSFLMDDYKRLTAFGCRIPELASKVSEKGHFQELERLYETLSGKNPAWPIELWDMAQTTEAALLLN